MKIRKFLLVFSILAVMFSLTACSEEKEKPFDYDETEIVIQTMDYFEQYNKVKDEYKDYYMTDGTDFEQSAVKGIDQAVNNDKVGEFESFETPVSYYYSGGPDALANIDYTIENADDYVMVTVINHAANRDVEVTVKYVENPDYYIELDRNLAGVNPDDYRAQFEQMAAYYGMTTEELMDVFFAQYGVTNLDDFIKKDAQYQLGSHPYTPEEMVISAVYSKKELMGQAGMNTLLGMGTVFVVLIFISFIISLFKYLPKLFDRKSKRNKEEDNNDTPVSIPAPIPSLVPAGNENLAGDEELVAVITAAINAYEAANGNTNSKDRLVVRSIKRAR
ncbi:MAG: OadG family protein [Lachnospiraceae bacterium]|nr:OadG family protein [Lachnospiraceae bacterium]